MLEFFTTFSFGQIVIFIILLCIAVREAIQFFDWFAKWCANKRKPKEKLENRLKQNEEAINKIYTISEKRDIDIRHIKDGLELLIESDKDATKSYIVDKYYEFTQRGFIDCYSLDCLEKRYSCYTREGGNSYIESLMKELRDLPKKDN